MYSSLLSTLQSQGFPFRKRSKDLYLDCDETFVTISLRGSKWSTAQTSEYFADLGVGSKHRFRRPILNPDNKENKHAVLYRPFLSSGGGLNQAPWTMSDEQEASQAGIAVAHEIEKIWPLKIGAFLTDKNLFSQQLSIANQVSMLSTHWPCIYFLIEEGDFNGVRDIYQTLKEHHEILLAEDHRKNLLEKQNPLPKDLKNLIDDAIASREAEWNERCLIIDAFLLKHINT